MSKCFLRKGNIKMLFNRRFREGSKQNVGSHFVCMQWSASAAVSGLSSPSCSFSPLPDVQLGSYTGSNENETWPGWPELGTCLLIPAAAVRWQQGQNSHKVDGAQHF